MINKKKITNDKYKITVHIPNDVKAISIEISGWKSLQSKAEENIQKEINRIDKRLRLKAFYITQQSSVLENRYIVDYTNCKDGYARNEHTYFNLQIMLFPLRTLTNEEYNSITNEFLEILNSSQVFNYRKTKKV